MAAIAAAPPSLSGVTSDALATWPKGLKENEIILNEDELSLARMLLAERQSHLFVDWPPRGTDDVRKHSFFDQVAKLDASYPGGLSAYIQNGRRLLKDSHDGKNPFDGFTPSVPLGERLEVGNGTFDDLERRGVEAANTSAFVLVAGGLGERLGFSGIKVALPSETTTGRCFLQLYIESILALQLRSNREKGGEERKIPFAIMTSDDTHARTQKLLEENSFFGMDPSQITLLKQEKVACLADNEAALALDPRDKFAILTKPHGHGDVHTVLYSSGLLSTWEGMGVKWVLFFQDTNGLLFKAIPASLGVSCSRDLDVNSLAVPRKAKEAIGGLARLKHHDGREMVINVEYNQLDPLLRATTNPEGDVNDETGFSPFPGNINQIVLKLEPYRAELERTKGAITEFVNPKYKDETRTSFKSPTRLECNMQDYPKTLSPSARIGFTMIDVWAGYAPVKNNSVDAALKAKAGIPPHSAVSGEMSIYRANCMYLQKAGVEVEGPKTAVFADQETQVWARVVWSPSWAITFADVAKKVTAGTCRISQASTLVLLGEEIFLEDLDLNGALVVSAAKSARVALRGLSVENKGWILREIGAEEVQEEVVRMRGFKIQKNETREIVIDSKGDHEITS